ncbi:MAG: glycogen synthase GlgA [Nitrospirales bacterium]|nr:glycogen synthase GlgA [Nitrospirales bacterium]
MKILIAASEAVPFAKEGGLGDVVGTLPRFLRQMGHDVRVVMPRYRQIAEDRYSLKKLEHSLGVPMGIIGTLWAGVLEGQMPGTDAPVYFIEYDQFYDREGGLYNDPDGAGYLDNDNRFAFLSRASLELCRMIGFAPDVIHVHDWHTSAIPVYLNTLYKDDPALGKAATILTIHNMQHQGDFYPGLMEVLGVGWNHFNYLGLEKDNKLNLLKGGLYHSTLINTVSPTYAQEIQTPQGGYGLEGVVRERTADLSGILNGVDYDEWSPEADPYIARPYSAEDLSGKALCKEDVQRTFGLPVRPEVPVIGIVSRLVQQKGLDIIAEAIHRIMEYDLQLVLLGKGDVWANLFLGDLPRTYPEKFGCYIGYSNALAHKIEAGADFFLMPSRFEPCGLNQMYSLRYGTLPIVRATGGLNDTVENFAEETGEGTGFKFQDLTADAIVNTIGWAIHTYYNKKDAMKGLISRAMGKRFTWDDSAKSYEELYRRAVLMRIGAEESDPPPAEKPKRARKSQAKTVSPRKRGGKKA